MAKATVIAFALVAVFTTKAVGEPASWVTMMTDLGVDDEGRITGRSQHCDRIALRVASRTPPEVALEYTPTDSACAVEARAIALSFASSMVSGGFGRLYNSGSPPGFNFDRLFPQPRDFGPLPWTERLEWPAGSTPRWVPDVPPGVGPPAAPLPR